MKNKILVVLLANSIIFSSCNNDNDTTEVSDKKLLLSKITTIYYDNPNNPETTVGTLSYNDKGQLVASDSDGWISSFEYDTNGKIKKANYYKLDKTLEYYSVYNYDGEKLINIKSIYDNPSSNRIVSYTYDSNAKVTKSSLCQSDNCSNPSTEVYTYSGDNISIETSEISGTVSYTHKTESSYDDKLNPFTNIDKNLRIMLGGAYALSKNNYTSQKLSYKNSDGNWTQNQTITYTIQYNDANRPIKVIGKETNGNNYIQYNYEYVTK